MRSLESKWSAHGSHVNGCSATVLCRNTQKDRKLDVFLTAQIMSSWSSTIKAAKGLRVSTDNRLIINEWHNMVSKKEIKQPQKQKT